MGRRCKEAEEMRTALVFILTFTIALAGRKYLIETGKSCTDKTGAVYKDGESWTCADGCNRCRCSNGVVTSTRMRCNRVEGNPCDQLVGMTVGLAKTVIRNEVVICHGQRIRIRTMRAVSVDGVRQPMTFDYRPSRLDVEIENGKIVKYHVIPL